MKFIHPTPITVEGTKVVQAVEPLIGVNVLVKETNHGMATEIGGKFTLEDVDEDAVLVVSYVGYQIQEVPVAGYANLTITLESDSQLLDDNPGSVIIQNEGYPGFEKQYFSKNGNR